MSHLSLRHLVAPASAAALVLLVGATPASARPDAGAPVTSATSSTTSTTSTDSGRCPLERIGTQLVRCDDLTGNGVAAPGWVAARSSATSTSTTTTASATTELDALTKFRRHGI